MQLIDSYLSQSDHISVDVGVPSQVQQVLELTVSVRECISLSADEIVRARWGKKYY